MLTILFENLFAKSRGRTIKYNFKRYWTISIFLICSGLFIIKSSLFGMDILTETPLTTLSKSFVDSLGKKNASNSQRLSDFGDLVITSSNKKKNIVGHRKKFNVILIILETTNSSFFSPSGPHNKYLPNLYKLAEEGLYLPQFFTPFPRSSKSFFAILTGHYPLTDYRSIIKVMPDIKIPTIFSILKNKEYSTFAGYSGDFRYDRMANFLENGGVDSVVDIYDNDGRYNQTSWSADDGLIYDQLINWTNNLEDNVPFFGLLLAMNSHHPFWTPKEIYKVVEEHDQMDRYINAIHYQDFLIGKLIDYLKRTKKLKNTIIIITGDHGAVFNFLKEKDTKVPPHLLDQDAFKVPFYLFHPLLKTHNNSSDIIGSHVDILPTILDLLGIETGQKFQGRSIFDKKITDRISFIYTDYYHHIVGGLTKNYVLMRNMTTDTTILSNSLDFNQNVCDSEKEVCLKLLSKVEEFDKFQNQRLFSLTK